MTASADTADADRLLACTPGRLLFRSRDAATGKAVVCKRFEQGSLADAQREFLLGSLAGHLDVAQHLQVQTEPRTGRPLLVTAFAAGDNLEQLVARLGPLPAAMACEVMLPVARTLAAMHELHAPQCPFGMCHGDIKPTNLLRTNATTLLLDFEHARTQSAPGQHEPRGAVFSGGSHGFAPPEARQGDAPVAAFDIYGLGATLLWLLQGQPRVQLPRNAALQRVLDACLSPDPAQRPNAKSVAIQLDELRTLLADDPTELALAAQLRAAATTRPDAALQSRQQRFLQRFPELLREATAALPKAPDELLAALRRNRLALRAFARHPALLQRRQRLVGTVLELLTAAAARTTAAVRDEQHAAASRWLQTLAAAVRLVRALPGGLPLPTNADPHNPNPALRDPVAYLQALLRRVTNSHDELADAEREITAAERRLDLPAAERAIGVLAAERGGASPTATRRRDQLHRLAFYVDRISRAASNVERLAPLWDAAALQPLSELTARCIEANADDAGPSRNDGVRGNSGSVVGLRSLSVTLTNLIEEYPHLADAASPAREALDAALLHTTDQAWLLLEDAHNKLQAVPVPVRPLQMMLGRLDTLRILEAFVDRPERARSDLQDNIEQLRLTCEEARSTRDRLASSAEQALARGHWTTGLFDMERAVASHAGEETDRHEAHRLEVRLAEARRRKQEVEAAVRRNVELAGRYATQQDDPAGNFQSRLSTLAERRDVLQFLMVHVQTERGELYARDLLDVEIQIALERAALAESQFDHTVEPSARLALAQQTLHQLGTALQDLGPEQSPPGRVVRLCQHWQSLVAQCQQTIAHAEQHRRRLAQRRRRNVWLALAAGALIVTSSIALQLLPWPWLGTPVNAAANDDREVTFQRIAADPAAALARAQARAAELPPHEVWLLQTWLPLFTAQTLQPAERGVATLRQAAALLHATTDASLTAPATGALVTQTITAAICLLGRSGAGADGRVAAAELVKTAVARGVWNGLEPDELLRRCCD